LFGGGQFLDVHLDGAVASHIDNCFVGERHFGADGGRQAIPHGAEPPGGCPLVRFVKFVKLGGPHLVLADLCGDNGIPVGEFVKLFNNILGLDDLSLIDIRHGVFFCPLVNGRQPGFMAGRHLIPVEITGGAEPVVDGREGIFTVGDNGDVDLNVFTDRSGVDVNMDDGGMGGKGVETAGNPVIKTGADGDQEITVGYGHVGGITAMHAEHAHGERVAAGKAAKPHQGHGYWDIEFSGQFGQFFMGIGKNDATADIENRVFGLHDLFAGLFYLARMGLIGRLVVLHSDRFLFGKVNHLGNNILGQINKYRAWTTGAGDVEGLAQRGNQVFGVFDQIIMFGAGAGDTDDIHLLEGIIADQGSGNLAGEDDHGDGIHICGGNRCDAIGCAWAGGEQGDPDFAGHSGQTVCRMDCALFVADKNIGDVGIHQGVIEVNDRASGETENNFYSFFLKAAYNGL